VALALGSLTDGARPAAAAAAAALDRCRQREDRASQSRES
jgi:hypothetical protein